MTSIAEPFQEPSVSADTILEPIIDPFEPLPDAVPVEADLYQQAMDLIVNGGPVMLVLGIASVVGLSVVFIKLLQFSQTGMIWSRRSIEKSLLCWQQGKVDAALAWAKKSRHPAGVVLQTAMEGTLELGGQDHTVREEVERVAMRQIAKSSRYIGLLDVISQLAPLLGLLGTILGMISAFQALQGAGAHADPALLAGGIWEALLTTAAGLSVALPMTLFYYLLDGYVQSSRHVMEDAVTRVFTWSTPVDGVIPLRPAANHNATYTTSAVSEERSAQKVVGSYAIS